MGIRLDIKAHTLDEIRYNNRDDARTCCRETFKHWLENAADAASWNSLIQALESDSISQKTLAKDIREKLLPGKVLYFCKLQKFQGERFLWFTRYNRMLGT